jgi:Ca2+-binding EF-hand superfamily protein
MKKFILLAVIASSTTIAADRVATYDFDKDGKVSFADLNRYCDVSETLFKRADKNSDGFLSEAEMRTAKEYLFNRCADRFASVNANLNK